MQRRLEQIDESIKRYLSQLDTADRQEPAVPEAKIARLNEKIATLRQEIQRLNALNGQMMQTEDKQISLTDPGARSMATSGRGSGIVGYNVQTAVDTKNHLVVCHEVTNVGHDRSQLSYMAEQAKSALNAETLDVVADRGYYSGEEIVACERRAYPSVCRSPQRQTQRPTAGLTNKISSMSRRTMFIAVLPVNN
jgi:hypothetical protein